MRCSERSSAVRICVRYPELLQTARSLRSSVGLVPTPLSEVGDASRRVGTSQLHDARAKPTSPIYIGHSLTSASPISFSSHHVTASSLSLPPRPSPRLRPAPSAQRSLERGSDNAVHVAPRRTDEVISCNKTLPVATECTRRP
ncbi:hypothetical protein PsYK624_106610 [Phanerochaete sordida]|uniref:Uncharacterized protein n=1 Tax=Phanerochaete sordida TaxID=48140 RepID=A0A9P3GGG0_9APHY|nr:hypothetical protein PsYK624_106610 [Phanerochaete sordida]